jgi:peptidyl-prolyl cis-trans isomerase C
MLDSSFRFRRASPAIALALTGLLMGTAGAAPAVPAAAAGSAPFAVMVNGVALPPQRAEYLLQQELARGAVDTPQLRSVLREALIDQALMAQAAVKTGLDKQAPVVTQLDLARQSVLVQAWQRQVLQGIQISDADLKQEYQQQVQTLGNEQVRLRHVLLANEKLALQVQVKLQAGTDFDTLAKQYSGDAGTREQGGLSDWLPEGRLDPAIVSAIHDLKAGKLAVAPVKTEAGWQIIKLEERRPFVAPAMDKVESQLRQAIARRLLQLRLKSLRDGANLEVAK